MSGAKRTIAARWWSRGLRPVSGRRPPSILRTWDSGCSRGFGSWPTPRPWHPGPPVRIRPLVIDITDQASIKAAVEEVAEAVGDRGLAGLVNNAGAVWPGPLEFQPIDEFRAQLEINLVGHLAVIQAFLPLIRRGHGRIVNVGIHRREAGAAHPRRLQRLQVRHGGAQRRASPGAPPVAHPGLADRTWCHEDGHLRQDAGPPRRGRGGAGRAWRAALRRTVRGDAARRSRRRPPIPPRPRISPRRSGRR